VRLVFLGTPQAAVPSLHALIDAGHDVIRRNVSQPVVLVHQVSIVVHETKGGVCRALVITAGIEIEVEDESSDETDDPNEVKKITKQIKGLTEAQENCAVVVFSDADFISDQIAYRNAFFGKMVVGDNSALVLNTIDDLSGSGDLVSIRSRGNFKRPFVVVDEIERQAEEDTREEVAKINAQIAGFQNELQSILSSAKAGEEEVIGSSILEKQRDIELKQRRAQQQLNEVKLKKREKMERLGNVLRGFNMLMTPAVILLIAIVLGIRRSVRKRHYISHASDA